MQAHHRGSPLRRSKRHRTRGWCLRSASVSLPARPSWWSEAACAGAPIEVFFAPERGSRQGQLARALAYCERCPVIGPCLDDARAEEAGRWPVGIRGGLTGPQRRALQHV